MGVSHQPIPPQRVHNGEDDSKSSGVLIVPGRIGPQGPTETLVGLPGHIQGPPNPVIHLGKGELTMPDKLKSHEVIHTQKLTDYEPSKAAEPLALDDVARAILNESPYFPAAPHPLSRNRKQPATKRPPTGSHKKN